MTANTDIVTLGALVTVDATRAVRICASGNPRIERGELLTPLLQHCVPLGPQRLHAISAARLRAWIAVAYRTGLRCSETLDLVTADLQREEGAIVVRHGKGDKHGIVMMDEWGWRELDRWMILRRNELPDGYVFPCIRQYNAGRRWSTCIIRAELRELQHRSGIGKRVAPHQLRHGHAVELWREGVDMYTIQQQLRHANLNVTAQYLRGVDPIKVLQPIKQRHPPMVTIN